MNSLILGRPAFSRSLQSLCLLRRKPFSAELVAQQFATPYSRETLSRALGAYRFDAPTHKIKPNKLHQEAFPLIATEKAKDLAAQRPPSRH